MRRGRGSPGGGGEGRGGGSNGLGGGGDGPGGGGGGEGGGGEGHAVVVLPNGQCRGRRCVPGSLGPWIAERKGARSERALPGIGLGGVSGVGVGKAISFRVEAADEAAAR